MADCSPAQVNFVNLIKEKQVIVLNSKGGWKPAMLVNSAGEQQELTCFKPDPLTEAYHSCSVIWNNQLFIFGGKNEPRQISQLTGYNLERVGNLTFDHEDGSCSNMANEYVFLCFTNLDYSSDSKLCRRSTGPLEQFSELAASEYDHYASKTSCSDSK